MEELEYKTKRTELTLECMALAHLINEETEYCVFLDYHGHVGSIDIRIAASKRDYHNYVCEAEIYTRYGQMQRATKEEKIIASLTAKRDVLRVILETEDIPYDEMIEHITTHRQYSF